MDQLNHQFQTFLEEFETNKSKIPDQELQKLQYILKCIELEGIDKLEFDKTLFPDIQQDVLQTIFNMPINAKKSMFIALMKSQEINQEKEVIEGELDIKQEVYSQWKTIQLKLNIENGILQIFKQSSDVLKIDLQHYVIEWEGKFLSFSKKFGFKLNAIDKSVKQKHFFLGSDDQKYAHEWFGWFQLFYKQNKKELHKTQIIQRRDSIGSEKRQSFLENLNNYNQKTENQQQINMMASNDQPHEKAFQVQLKNRSQSFSGSLEKALKKAKQKLPLSKFYSDDVVTDNSGHIESELSVNDNISEQPLKHFGHIIQERHSDEQGTPSQEAEFEDALPIENHSINETLDDNIPEQLRTLFQSKEYQIERILNLNGYRIEKVTDQYRIYIGIKNELQFKGHIAFQKKHDNIKRFFENQKVLNLIKDQDNSQVNHCGQINGSKWRLMKVDEHQRFQATFVEPNHNNTIELVYFIEIGFIEQVPTYSLILCIFFFKQHLQCAYDFKQDKDQPINMDELHENLINILME